MTAVPSFPVAGQEPPEADPADVASVEAIIEAGYDAISGGAGEEREGTPIPERYGGQATGGGR